MLMVAASSGLSPFTFTLLGILVAGPLGIFFFQFCMYLNDQNWETTILATLMVLVLSYMVVMSFLQMMY